MRDCAGSLVRAGPLERMVRQWCNTIAARATEPNRWLGLRSRRRVHGEPGCLAEQPKRSARVGDLRGVLRTTRCRDDTQTKRRVRRAECVTVRSAREQSTLAEGLTREEIRAAGRNTRRSMTQMHDDSKDRTLALNRKNLPLGRGLTPELSGVPKARPLE
jgi:hypothetical protein